VPVDFACELEGVSGWYADHGEELARESHAEEIDALPDEVRNAIDWEDVGREWSRVIEYGGIFFDVTRFE
jgi:hypothetical protein